MKKLVKHFVSLLSLLLVLSVGFSAAGCSGNAGVTKPSGVALDGFVRMDASKDGTENGGQLTKEPEIGGFKLPYSAGQATEDFYNYDSSLYYLNETRVSGADPGALFTSVEDITDSYTKLMHSWQYLDENGEWQWQKGRSQEAFEAEYGTLQSWLDEYANWYYMIVTGGGDGSAYQLRKSKDLFDWKVGGKARYGNAIEIVSTDWCIDTFWAPEFIRDPASGLYFIFFSANSKNGNANTAYSANSSTTGYDFDGLQVSCAMSANPVGPYHVVTAKDYLEHRAMKDENGNVKTGTEQIAGADLNRDGSPDVYFNEIYDVDGNVIGYKKGTTYYTLNGYTIGADTPVLNIGYYYPRCASDAKKVAEMENEYHVRNLKAKKGIEIKYDNCLFPCIDVNPVLGSDGTMMLYFSQHVSSFNSSNNVWCVKMKDWMTPDWDTLTHISTPNYVSIIQDGSFKGQFGAVTSWPEGSINEGTEVLEHEGKWYFTYSPFGYSSRQYSLYVGVSDEPTGPFTKLGLAYSPIIGIGTEYNNYMSGTGHHVFIKAGDELWALYHCFYNPEDNNDNKGNFMGRCIGADRVYWKYTEELGYDMMYGNGPTYNLQPKPESFTGYTNVAKYAAITGTGDVGDVDVLTDGMFTAQPFSRQWEYGSTEGKLKIKLTWDEPVEITAFHIYNSGSYYNAFKTVKSVLFKLADKPAWYNFDKYNGYCYIQDLPTFSEDYIDRSGNVVRKGAAAMAQFNKITVTEMTIFISGAYEDKYTDMDEDFGIGNTKVAVPEIYIFGNKVNK